MDQTSYRTWGQTVQACATSGGGIPAPPWTRRRAVFLDRDGTLIVDRPYLSDPARIELLPGVIDGLARLRDAGYLLVVATNQSGIARGYYDGAALAAMHRRLGEILAQSGIQIAAYYYCPHHVDGRVPSLARSCPCRKPGPGMLWRAAADWAIDLDRSWMIGDRVTDAQAAEAAGCASVLVGSSDAALPVRCHQAPDLAEAADYIIGCAGFASLKQAEKRRSVPRG